jgi:hypothetical protein
VFKEDKVKTEKTLCFICDKEAVTVYDNIYDEFIPWCGSLWCGLQIQCDIDYAEEHKNGS